MRAKRLLIVEDDPALLRGLKDNFRAEGYQVRTASDGQKGLADMMRDPPDLVLLDLMLPKVSGYEICRAARSRQLSTPILMLTARTHEDDILRGLSWAPMITSQNHSASANSSLAPKCAVTGAGPHRRQALRPRRTLQAPTQATPVHECEIDSNRRG